MFLTWLISNYKGIILFSLIASVAGYVYFLRASVDKQALAIDARKKEIAVLSKDLEQSKDAIENMNKGMKNFRTFVEQALLSMKKTQDKIAKENKQFQAMLDNLSVLATIAERIIDAPQIPFFMGDNVVGGSILISNDNGVSRYRMLPPMPPATH